MTHEKDLLADPKERAEHVMLVDLARNDIGRVCDYQSVEVKDLMIIERYSHVMHIVSQVEGRLSTEHTPYDLIRATFPAGTLSGAPKIRAMQIISELEQTARGPYGGCVGYFSFNGNLDCCITIRTALIKDGMAHVQAGGGWVSDSVPEDEFMETVNKSKAMIKAVTLAESWQVMKPDAPRKDFALLIGLIVIGGTVLSWLLVQTGPRVTTEEEVKAAKMVKVQELTPKRYPIFVAAHGTVIPARRVSIEPEVSGLILSQHPKLRPGGMIMEGEVLFTVDTTLAAIAVEEASAALVQASINLEEATRQHAEALRLHPMP